MKNQDKPASFIGKLYNILKSKQHCKAIIWDSQLNGIKVLNQKKLQETVLPRYYRHNRFASFVRQLNMYDFHKIHLGDHKSIFTHDTFNPKIKETIYIVKRKVTFNIQITDKNSNSDDKQQISEIKNSLKSLKKFLPLQEQSIWNQRSSFRLLKNSLRFFDSRCSSQIYQQNKITEEQAIQQLLQQILPLNLTPQQTRLKVRKLGKNSIYKYHLRSQQFKRQLYVRLGLEYDGKNQNLSELSIQGQLLIRTRKTLTQRSLKMFDSGPLIYRDDTVRALMQ